MKVSARAAAGPGYNLFPECAFQGIRTGRRRTVTAFAYIMHEERPIGIPSNYYMRTCLEGYDTFGFDRHVLFDAYDKCVEACENEG